MQSFGQYHVSNSSPSRGCGRCIPRMPAAPPDCGRGLHEIARGLHTTPASLGIMPKGRNCEGTVTAHGFISQSFLDSSIHISSISGGFLPWLFNTWHFRALYSPHIIRLCRVQFLHRLPINGFCPKTSTDHISQCRDRHIL